jgi:type IV secretion system T-DNA border endonuclease VirD1
MKTEASSLFPEPITWPTKSKSVDPNAYKIVSVRLREAEFEAFSDQARALGLTNNLALRIAARRIGGFLEIDEETRALLQLTADHIGMLSRSIIGLQAVCREVGRIDMKEFAALRASFGRDFAMLDTRLATILNISKRRSDGRLMLETAQQM